jgi:hypothetical protein
MPNAQSTESRRVNHTWRFFRAGGFDQVRLDTGADLAHLDELDQKLWVALACPTRGLEFDPKTLALIDTDKDGRIRVPEILAAVQWAVSMLKDPDQLVQGTDALPLAAINDATPEGRQLLASARRILTNLGKPEATVITIDDTTDTTKIFAQTRFNGDGIVPVDAAPDAPTQAVLRDIIDCLGPETDRSGKPGVSQAKLDQFFAEAAAFSDWWKRAETDPAILPLGDKTAEAVAALKAVKAKIDDYFARCRLAAFDPRAVTALNRQESEYLALVAKDLSITADEVRGFPLARIEAGRPLPLKEGLNPAWIDAMRTFDAAVVKPLLGDKTALTEAEWTSLCAKLAPFDAWQAAKAGASVERLGLKRVREILASSSHQAITALIAQDKALEPEANAIAAVDKLVRFCRDLHKLLNNFVSFRDFYTRRDKAIFQAGTLYLDQRSCELCLPVEDPAKHAAMAGLAGTYLAYCDCTRPATGEKMQVVAAFTDGDSDNLMVGRNGLFYDRKGRDWDATITRIVDNPISLRQAFWAPYKKLVRFIEEQAPKRAAAAEAASAAKLEAAATTVVSADKAKPPEPKKLDTGTVAALGVGLGAIATVVGGFVSGFLKLNWWQMALAVVGLLLVISGPSMVIAWLKLRKRNLGPILDANGWAINARAKISVPFGKALTRVRVLPPGSARELTDPYASKKWPWILAVVVAAAVGIGCWLYWGGHLHRWTQGRFGVARPSPTTSQTNTVPSQSASATNPPAR